MKTSKLTFMAGMLIASAAFANTGQVPNVSAKDLNQNARQYLGKRVALTGQVDRVLGNGGYIISDSNNTKDSSHRILIFTSTPPKQTNTKQQAGVAAPNLKEGDTVQLNGKVEEFMVSNEVDTFAPKTDTETINEAATAVPVLIVQPSDVLKG